MDNLNVEVIVLIDNVWYRINLEKFSMSQTPQGMEFEIKGKAKDEWEDEINIAN